ncbi:MAG TPA: 30S ribosomal protein S12 methylthiotransferase RimO [Acidobacteriaceae bacterium]|nr:30S ribosomal protein S12 methylthiotransferase RimO [Acidobacteriaceae bacterium]
MTLQPSILPDSATAAVSEDDSFQPQSGGTPSVSVGFVSLGCPKNLIDSEVMMGLLARSGATITPNAEDADVLVVNTCSFIEKAKQESVDTILEMARLKNEGRATRLVVAGCMVERYRQEIQKNLPEVDAVVGTGELEDIVAAAGILIPPQKVTPKESPFHILSGSEGTTAHRPEGIHREAQGRFSRESWDGAISSLPNYLYDEHTPRLRTTARTSAYIKIAEGCDHPCGFCIIPQLRGKFRSRRFESVVAEAQRLVNEGVQEITLIGQDTTCYGEDFGMRDGLAQLLDRLAQIDGLRWIRFLYAYPNKVTQRLLDTMGRHENICKYLDVPLQHASPNVLKRMKRGGGAEIFLKLIEKARRAMPDIALRTSFITGFPGETEADFDLLQDFVQAARFDWLGVFEYSDEEGSAAYHLDAKVPKRSIAARQRRLMRTQLQISRARRRAQIGQFLEVLVEGESEETPLLWQGRAAMHAPEIDGKILINDFGPHESLRPGSFHLCQVTEAHDYDLVVRVVA